MPELFLFSLHQHNHNTDLSAQSQPYWPRAKEEDHRARRGGMAMAWHGMAWHSCHVSFVYQCHRLGMPATPRGVVLLSGFECSVFIPSHRATFLTDLCLDHRGFILTLFSLGRVPSHMQCPERTISPLKNGSQCLFKPYIVSAEKQYEKRITG